jgi:hypothetical protein
MVSSAVGSLVVALVPLLKSIGMLKLVTYLVLPYFLIAGITTSLVY